ncbi:hypothetical protein DTO164E3_8683 [Paecilomyces variotii]|nr:hypothetical protein DTO164E3_8683 [Paecilomyces variotii]KAJ9286940.1 hypothetical protein DTO021C3_5460 [Paecilomyces variotii]
MLAVLPSPSMPTALASPHSLYRLRWTRQRDDRFTFEAGDTSLLGRSSTLTPVISQRAGRIVKRATCYDAHPNNGTPRAVHAPLPSELASLSRVPADLLAPGTARYLQSAYLLDFVYPRASLTDPDCAVTDP